MLIIAKQLKELSFRKLMEVYIEGNREKAAEEWPHLPECFGLQQAEQDFYQYLQESFFSVPEACYAIWVENGHYLSALRLEPYRDGLLLEALETCPEYRRQGYATMLIRAVQSQFAGRKIYSHVHKQNAASLRTHGKCAFHRILEYASYIDGSVNYRACTMLYE